MKIQKYNNNTTNIDWSVFCWEAMHNFKIIIVGLNFLLNNVILNSLDPVLLVEFWTNYQRSVNKKCCMQNK